MNQAQIEVLVILDITNLKDKQNFEKHVQKEGFLVVENENFVYTGKSTTTLFATKAYILEVFAKALTLQNFDGEANLIFLLNDKAHPTYTFSKPTNEFVLIQE